MCRFSSYSIAFLLTFIISASCTNEKRYKTPTGLRYKLYSKGKDSIIRMGQTVKYHISHRAGDSIIENTYGVMPKYWMCMPGFGHRYQPLEVFDYGIRRGDSLVIIRVVDSMVNNNLLDTIPFWMKAGDEWITHLKVVDVFDSDSSLYADKEKEGLSIMQLQRKLGIKRIEKHLKAQKTKAELIGDSLYMAYNKTGTGIPAQNGNTILAHFDVVSLKGKILNSSRNSSAQGPLSFILGNGFFPNMIENQLDGVNTGSMVSYYIPGILLFGPEPQRPDVRADDDWKVTIEVLEVK